MGSADIKLNVVVEAECLFLSGHNSPKSPPHLDRVSIPLPEPELNWRSAGSILLRKFVESSLFLFEKVHDWDESQLFSRLDRRYR